MDTWSHTWMEKIRNKQFPNKAVVPVKKKMKSISLDRLDMFYKSHLNALEMKFVIQR